MAPRSAWKGYIKLNLISVPVKAFAVENTSADIRLVQLHDACHCRVKQRRVCPEHGELDPKSIVSGYEHAKNDYVVIDPQELNKLRTESDHSIHIEGFVEPGEIDAGYLSGRNYILMPDGVSGERSYALLEEGMRRADVHAIAQVVIAGREQLVSLRSAGGLLQMSVLHYAEKVRSADSFADELQQHELTEDELRLTGTLIDASRIDTFDITSYNDKYAEKLSRLIQLKTAGQAVVKAPIEEEPRISNLMEALKSSVANANAGSSRKMAPSQKMSPARRKKTGS